VLLVACVICSGWLSDAGGRELGGGLVARYVLRFTAKSTPDQRLSALVSVGARRIGEIEALRLTEIRLEPVRLAALRADPSVQWVHREGTAHIAGLRPNDPLFGRQWPLKRLGAVRGWRVEDGRHSAVTVAVVDTGVDPSHPDLQKRLLRGFDTVNLDDDPADDHGHGTHVAGIIAARPNNHEGIAGLSWGVRILPLKACDTTGACPDFDVVASIVRAIESGAKVVNLSLAGLGIVECPPEYEAVAKLAESREVLLVAAAGNSAQDGNPVLNPAACDGYVGVGATTRYDTWAPFSEHHDYVDLSAPGMEVVSTIPPGLPIEDDPSTRGYGPLDGTSMAAPHVAGLAALLFARHPGWSAEQILRAMQRSAVDLGEPGRDPYFGAGRISLARALEAR
jgi:thermitase